MMQVLIAFIKTRVGQILLALLIGLGVGAWAWNHFHPSTTIIKNVPGQSITIEKPVIQERDVIKYIQDPAQAELVKKVMAENKSLGLKVNQLQTAVARNETHGGTTEGGKVEAVTRSESESGVLQSNGSALQNEQIRSFDFKDWQLDARYTTDGNRFNYTLFQDFTVVTTSGRDSEGHKVGLVHLYQKGPDGKPRLINAQVTNIFNDETAPRFMKGFKIQGGLGVDNQNRKLGELVIVQWLTHGKSHDPNETRWAVLSPAIMFSQGGARSYGVLPISFNVGTISHNPFSNIWFSPFVTKGNVAAVVSFTF